MRTFLIIAAGLVAASAAVSEELRLNFDNAPTLTVEDPASVATLDDLLSLTPRLSGLNMTVEALDQGAADTGAFRLGYGQSAGGVDLNVFTGIAGVDGGRFGHSRMQPMGGPRELSLEDDLILSSDPALAGRDSLLQVGGSIGYGGLSFGADFARETRLQNQAEYRDYRLGVGYRGADWGVRMQYMRSLSSGQETLLGVSDAIELGGVWSVTGSVDLVGGIQFWDQQTLGDLDASNDRDALVFFGTRIQF
jgi:hypothetical protein